MINLKGLLQFRKTHVHSQLLDMKKIKLIWALILFFSCLHLNGQQNALSNHVWNDNDATELSSVSPENGVIKCENKVHRFADGGLNSLNAFSPDHDWKKLFNGDNLEGWNVKCKEKDQNNTFWTVNDGSIFCNSMGSRDHDYIWLLSEEEYGDFELRLKFKVSRENLGNSGIQVRSRYDELAIIEGEPGWLDGPQVDIDPGNPWRIGLIYDETRTSKRWIHPSLPDWKIDKETHAPERVIFYWEDEGTGWNDMTIICKGTTIQTLVNNVLISDFNGEGLLDDENHRKYKVGMKGHIGLQLHKNSENKIWFKDIEIREL